MNKQLECAGVIIIASWTLAVLLVASGLTDGCNDLAWKRDAIKHGAAEYDQFTGDWRWKDEAPNTGRPDGGKKGLDTTGSLTR